MPTEIPCSFMRGGTSRGAVLATRDLPEDPTERDALLLRLFGSPDRRQIDGLGAGDPLTSKAMLVESSERDDVDLAYTFAQVGVTEERVSYGGNCGNMTSAVAVYAVNAKLIDVPDDGQVVVRMHNLNTDRVIHAEVQVANGRALSEGAAALPGVPGTGSPIYLNFIACEGSMTGTLFPTGNRVDAVQLFDGGQVDVSLVDAATPFVFVRASDIGAVGNELPDSVVTLDKVMTRLEDIRSWAVEQLGIAPAANATKVSPNVPRVSMVSAPTDSRLSDGREQLASDVDLVARQMAMQQPHRAYAVTGGICTAVAASVEGTVVHALAHQPESGPFRIGHPLGTIDIEARVRETESGVFTVERAVLMRTAREILAGVAYI